MQWKKCVCVVLYLVSAQPAEPLSSLHQETDFVSADVGDEETLHCSYEGEAARLYWYKQTLGQKPRLISTYYRYEGNGIFYNEFKSNPRFTLVTGISKNHLKITDLRVSDSATYYCATSFTFILEFTKETYLNVKGSSLDIQTFVLQSLSETIQPGDSVTLKSALGPVMKTTRFTGSKTLKNLIQDSFTPMAAGMISVRGKPTKEHTPVSLTWQWKAWMCLMLGSTTALSPHVDTYCSEEEPRWCLEVSSSIEPISVTVILLSIWKENLKYREVCAQNSWLFTDEAKSLVLVYVLSGALTFTSTLVVLLAFLLYKMSKRNHFKSGTGKKCCIWQFLFTDLDF